MPKTRVCRDCKGLINLNIEDYFIEKRGNRKTYQHKECGKRCMGYSGVLLRACGVTLHIHFGVKCPIKSFTAQGLLVVNADFPEGVETERIPIGGILARVDWSNTAPEERKEIESKFVEAFGGGIAV